MDHGPARRAIGLDEHAAESLAVIRSTLERSAAFGVLPGAGGVGMGAIGLAAAAIAARQPDDLRWIAVWLAAAPAAAGVGLVAVWRKARRHAVPVWSPSGRRFALGFFPALCAGAVLTAALASRRMFEPIPAAWLLLYGAGILSGSAASIRVLVWLGASFMLLGIGAAASTAVSRDLWLAAGFGGLQMIFGLVIARKHGG